MDEPWLKWVSILVIGDPNQSYYIYNIWYMIYIHYMHNFIPEIFCRTLMTIIYPLNVTWTLLKNHWRERIQWILENSHGKITPLIHISQKKEPPFWAILHLWKRSTLALIWQVSNKMLLHRNRSLAFCLLRIPLQCQLLPRKLANYIMVNIQRRHKKSYPIENPSRGIQALIT